MPDKIAADWKNIKHEKKREKQHRANETEQENSRESEGRGGEREDVNIAGSQSERVLTLATHFISRNSRFLFTLATSGPFILRL